MGPNNYKLDSDSKLATRRGVIGATLAIVGSSGLAGSAAAAATEEEGESVDFDLVVEEGQLKYTGDDSLSVHSESPDIHRRAESPDGNRREYGDGEYVEVNGAAIQEAIEAINEAADEGLVEIYEKDGEAYVKATGKATEDVSEASTLSTHCGKNDYYTETTLQGGVRERFYMDDTLTRRVRNRLVVSGGISGAAAAAAGVSGIGVSASALLGIIAAISTAGATLLTQNNDGCGVRVTFYPASFAVGPGGAILAGLYFDPQ